MADPVAEFVAEWIEENVTPELSADGVDPDTVQEHLSALIAEADDEGISEEDIEESGLDIPALIEKALKSGDVDEAEPDEDD
jgi:hypothetical protein